MKPITKLSPKQKLVLKWAHLTKFKNQKAIICDGSVRSGKTVSMILGFVHWAMRFFDGKISASAERPSAAQNAISSCRC